MTTTQITVVGKSSLRDGEGSAACDCCGREIRKLVYMSNGQVWGQGCAAKRFSTAKIAQAWRMTAAEANELVSGSKTLNQIIDARMVRA